MCKAGGSFVELVVDKGNTPKLRHSLLKVLQIAVELVGTAADARAAIVFVGVVG